MGMRQLTAYTEWLERQGVVIVPEDQTHESMATAFMQAGQPAEEELLFNVVTAPAVTGMVGRDPLTDWPVTDGTREE